MKFFLLPIFIFLFVSAHAQHRVTLKLTDNSGNPVKRIFVAGDFNGWNPNDSAYELRSAGDRKWETIFTAPDGDHNYKYTQGSWDIAEANAAGADAQNRLFNLSANTTLYDSVPAWTNKEAAKPRMHTASLNVRVIDTAFSIPQLDRKRRIWIYLPVNYNASSQRYPVLYMHDGQNLFDEFTGPFGEWGVDEALDSLQQQTGKYCIVVGVDHGADKRMTEYDPYDTKRFGKEEGVEYAEFLAKTLKPYIDMHYRTKKGAANTAVAGSSMGGLISTYIVLKYPNEFGAAGIFSPAYWIAPSLKDYAKETPVKNKKLRFWFYAGEEESKAMVPDMQAMKEIVAAKYNTDIFLVTDPNASHNEGAWRKWFPEFYRWWVK